ncbi:ComEC/Rec2 family competence protein [Lacibacterium aquatile]|uniref:ComEC/Rec2 family competence protein n=1 Tax=Lacibacterium aquatile TaxID=1168082 RepID=A0ABW5DT32_9PROT
MHETFRLAPRSFAAKPRLIGRLQDWLTAEAVRLPLLGPLWLAAGIGGYFALAWEPEPWVSVVCGGLGLCLLAARGRLMGVTALALMLLGFALAAGRSHWLATPMLSRTLAAESRIMEVVQIDRLSYGTRLVVRLADGMQARVTAPIEAVPPVVTVGDRLSARLRLSPVAAPFAPGGYDLQRHLYFQGIGATGWIEGTISHDPQPVTGWRVGLERFRARLQQAVHGALPEREAAIAAALIVGEQGAIADSDARAMRVSGLSHLLSISGLHIGLVAWIFLGGLSLVLSAIPALVLRWPARKLAAYPALLAILGYSLLAGWDIPVQRSFLMYALVLLALMVNRDPWSLRSVALAAFAVLILTPEALLSPGFQMSFAAVLVLIAGWERVQPRLLALREAGGWPFMVASWLVGMVASSLLATLATTPFAVHHFQQPAPYGILANMIAIPLSGIVIMPAAVLAVLGMAAGWPEPGFALLGWGIDLLLSLADGVAELPGANLLVPALPTGALLLIALGGIWLVLSASVLRWIGLAAAVVGLILSFWTPVPVAMVSAGGRAVGLAAEGRLLVAGLGGGSIQARAWGERVLTRDIGAMNCGALCLLKTDGLTVALVREARGVAEACRSADILLTLVPLRLPCPGPAIVRDVYDAEREGAVAIYRSADGLRIDSDRDHRGQRPWVVR